MKNSLERSKFTIALILLVQSVTLLVVAVVQWSRRKSLAGTFLALSAMGGVIGTVLMMKSAPEEDKRQTIIDTLCGEYLDLDDDMFNEFDDEDFEVPTSDDVDETEFH